MRNCNLHSSNKIQTFITDPDGLPYLLASGAYSAGHHPVALECQLLQRQRGSMPQVVALAQVLQQRRLDEDWWLALGKSFHESFQGAGLTVFLDNVVAGADEGHDLGREHVALAVGQDAPRPWEEVDPRRGRHTARAKMTYLLSRTICRWQANVPYEPAGPSLKGTAPFSPRTRSPGTCTGGPPSGNPNRRCSSEWRPSVKALSHLVECAAIVQVSFSFERHCVCVDFGC